jgi:hypothetical protein
MALAKIIAFLINFISFKIIRNFAKIAHLIAYIVIPLIFAIGVNQIISYFSMNV